MWFVYRSSDGFLLKRLSNEPNSLSVGEKKTQTSTIGGTSTTLETWVSTGDAYPYFDEKENKWNLIKSANFVSKDSGVFIRDYAEKQNNIKSNFNSVTPTTLSFYKFLDGENGLLYDEINNNKDIPEYKPLKDYTDNYLDDTRNTYKSSLERYIRKRCVQKAYSVIISNALKHYPTSETDSANNRNPLYTNTNKNYYYDATQPSIKNKFFRIQLSSSYDFIPQSDSFYSVYSSGDITNDKNYFTEFISYIINNGSISNVNIDLSELSIDTFIFPQVTSTKITTIIFPDTITTLGGFSNYRLQKVVFLGNILPTGWSESYVTKYYIPLDYWLISTTVSNKKYYTVYLDHLFDVIKRKEFTADSYSLNLKILDLSFLEGIQGTSGAGTYNDKPTPNTTPTDKKVRELALRDIFSNIKAYMLSKSKSLTINNLDLSSCWRMYQHYDSGFRPYQFDKNYFSEFTGVIIDDVGNSTATTVSPANLIINGANIVYPKYAELLYMLNEHAYTYQYLNKTYTYAELASSGLKYSDLNKVNTGKIQGERVYRNPLPTS